MKTANLSDERLNKRLISLLDILGNSPGESIPVACRGWAEIKTAYRFFDNGNVSAEKILAHLTSSIYHSRPSFAVLS